MNGGFVALVLGLGLAASLRAGLPEVRDPALRLDLIATAPEVVTPIGVAVDPRGRIFVAESHTHFPKTNYPGPKSDRILVFPGEAGKAPVVFWEGLRWTMNLVFGPEGALYATHRNGVVRFPQATGLEQARSVETVIQLETTATYPHNGLGGLAWGPDGWLYLGIGENLGAAYQVRGRDGSVVSAPDGAGGMIVRCRPDGSQVELWATGFWNAFALQFDPAGRLFMVDNDPDSRPPCRLVQVIRDGYYGFQFRHGRNGLSPFTAWEGELPGTLPIVAGTGEAPSGLLNASSTRFPNRYVGSWLVSATWANAIERYRLEPAGSSFRAEREVMVQGDENFRPVALAAAPDGSVVFTDWVKSDYNVHREGRLWRLSARTPRSEPLPAAAAPSAAEKQLHRLLQTNAPLASLEQAVFASEDPFEFSAAVSGLARQPWQALTPLLSGPEPRMRTAALLALRKRFGSPVGAQQTPTPVPVVPPEVVERETVTALRRGLTDPSPEVRTAALVWAGETRRTNLLAEVQAALQGVPVSPLLLAVQAEAVRWLAPSNSVAIAESLDGKVRVLSPPEPDPNRMRQAVLRLEDPAAGSAVRLEAVRDLSGTEDPAAVRALQRLVQDPGASPNLRAEAVLALTGTHEDHLTPLLPALTQAPPEVVVEWLRGFRSRRGTPTGRSTLESLRSQRWPASVEAELQDLLEPSRSVPNSDDDWRARLQGPPGDAAAGRRVFFSTQTGCAKCHRIEGRGGRVGPDLSTVARGSDRERLLAALLHPSRDVAPQFVTQIVTTKDGDEVTGRIQTEAANGSLILLNGEGTAYVLPAASIRERRTSPLSLMPEGLLEVMSPQAFRDLMAFLESRK